MHIFADIRIEYTPYWVYPHLSVQSV